MENYPYDYLDDSFFKRGFKNISVSLNIFTENEESQKIVKDLQFCDISDNIKVSEGSFV